VVLGDHAVLIVQPGAPHSAPEREIVRS